MTGHMDDVFSRQAALGQGRRMGRRQRLGLGLGKVGGKRTLRAEASVAGCHDGVLGYAIRR